MMVNPFAVGSELFLTGQTVSTLPKPAENQKSFKQLSLKLDAAMEYKANEQRYKQLGLSLEQYTETRLIDAGIVALMPDSVAEAFKG